LANKDLRNWIAELEAAGELHTISGADPKDDIGGIVDIVQRKMGDPALMFDDIPGFPKGHRVMSNLLTSTPRINIALGLPADASDMELIQWWREYMTKATMSISPQFPPRSGMNMMAGILSAPPAWW
jgi:UbiD family decarboxylase